MMSSVPTTLKYLDPEEVVTLLEGSETKQGTAILDVRDGDEFSSGHIAGACNLSSEQWQNQSFVDSAIQDNLDKKTVVFHCMLSQKRGPTCARIFSQRLSELNITDRPLPEV